MKGRATLSDVDPLATAASARQTRRRGRVSRLLLLLLCLTGGPTSAYADTSAYFRLFLANGSVIACLGEYARVGDRVVFSLPLGTDGTSRLMSLPASAVDWSKTDGYAESLRSFRYADARGEADFSALAGQVAAVLNEIALTPDPARKMQLAMTARHQLDSWPADHYNYRAADVRQIVQFLDEAISEMRAAAGEQQFDLSLVANVEAPPAFTALPEPTEADALTAAAAVADLADDPAEKLSLLESLADAVDKATAALSPAVATHLRTLVHARLDGERTVEASYSRLAVTAEADARTRAARADVKGVEHVMAGVAHQDDRLGRKRPARVAALLSAIRDQLDAARRLRLARDQWSVKIGSFRSYRRAVAAPLNDLDLMRAPLDDIKRLAGPDASTLPGLQTRLSAMLRTLDTIVAPPDLASAHALVESAARLAAQAVSGRQSAISSGAMDQAWQASSAAAGALMLLTRARHDLDAALTPPGVQ